MVITPYHYLVLSAALFTIGAMGVMLRRNIIIVFMSIELMLNAVNINLAAFSHYWQSAVGQVFAIFVIAVAAAEFLLEGMYAHKRLSRSEERGFSAQEKATRKQERVEEREYDEFQERRTRRGFN